MKIEFVAVWELNVCHRKTEICVLDIYAFDCVVYVFYRVLVACECVIRMSFDSLIPLVKYPKSVLEGLIVSKYVL